ncbi:MAG: DUF6064 family protein [Thermoanaerobaculia bacterium]
MPEWSTYRLEDLALFPPRAYWRMLESYNRAIWPAHLVALVLAVVMLVFVLGKRERWRGRVVAAILAGSCLWVAWAFHLERYASIHWAAKWFALGFAIEALLLVLIGVIAGRLQYAGASDAPRAAGLAVTLFALFVQPLIGPMLGRSWNAIELFAVHPDPTAIVTLGVVLLASERVHWPLLIVPAAWCLVSGATLLTLDAPDAMTAPLVAAVALCVAIWKSVVLRRASSE